MKALINGIDLEFDIFEADKAELFQRETEKVIEIAENVKGEQDLGRAIRIQCKAVFNFLDALFGEDTHKAVFGESVNLRECIKVYTDITNHIAEDKDAFAGLIKDKSKPKKK